MDDLLVDSEGNLVAPTAVQLFFYGVTADDLEGIFPGIPLGDGTENNGDPVKTTYFVTN